MKKVKKLLFFSSAISLFPPSGSPLVPMNGSPQHRQCPAITAMNESPAPFPSSQKRSPLFCSAGTFPATPVQAPAAGDREVPPGKAEIHMVYGTVLSFAEACHSIPILPREVFSFRKIADNIRSARHPCQDRSRPGPWRGRASRRRGGERLLQLPGFPSRRA